MRINIFFVALVFIHFAPQLIAQKGLERSVVLDAPDKSKQEILTAAQLFLVNSFKDSKEVIQMKDESAGIIAGKGTFNYQFSKGRFTCNKNNGKGHVQFTIKIFVRENRTKLVLSEFIHHSPSDPNVNLGLLGEEPPNVGFMQKCNTDIYHDIVSQIDKLIKRLEREFTVELSNDNDW